ncbi:MAG: hypothetical protein NVS2B11_10620 [Acetobacteraceae bacterium]
MVLLDHVERWDDGAVLCRTLSHLRDGNPLRRDGRLHAVCGIEYGLQAAALHGALRAGGVAQKAGYAASLRGVVLHADRLDDPALGALLVEARLEAQETFGMVYGFELRSEAGDLLLTGRASIALPR